MEGCLHFPSLPSPPLSYPTTTSTISTESSPAGFGVVPRLKTNLVHSKAARKPLVTISLSVLKCMLIVVQQLDQHLAQINMIKSAVK